jgi:hypothetical protein
LEGNPFHLKKIRNTILEEEASELSKHMMVFDKIKNFTLSLEGTEMDENIFGSFADIIINMTELKT